MLIQQCGRFEFTTCVWRHDSEEASSYERKIAQMMDEGWSQQWSWVEKNETFIVYRRSSDAVLRMALEAGK